MYEYRNIRTRCAALLAMALAAAPLAAQDFSAVEIRSTEIGAGVYVMEGAGGNLGLVVGEQSGMPLPPGQPLVAAQESGCSVLADRLL